MTTPTDSLDGIGLPYSAVLEPRYGISELRINSEMRNHTGPSPDQILHVQPGVAIVSVSYDGFQALTLEVNKDVLGSGTWFPLITIPAGADGENRMSESVYLATSTTAGLRASISPWANSAAVNNYRGGLTVYPIG